MRAVPINTLFAAAGRDVENLDVIMEVTPSGRFRLSAYGDDGTLVQQIISYEQAKQFQVVRDVARELRRRADVRKL